jgi:hypothetical protein
MRTFCTDPNTKCKCNKGSLLPIDTIMMTRRATDDQMMRSREPASTCFPIWNSATIVCIDGWTRGRSEARKEKRQTVRTHVLDAWRATSRDVNDDDFSDDSLSYCCISSCYRNGWYCVNEYSYHLRRLIATERQEWCVMALILYCRHHHWCWMIYTHHSFSWLPFPLLHLIH